MREMMPVEPKVPQPHELPGFFKPEVQKSNEPVQQPMPVEQPVEPQKSPARSEQMEDKESDGDSDGFDFGSSDESDTSNKLA